ncbi:LOW QUALITY PROTEIN: histamine H2 receptor [Macrotis lagotis]|uniref:LOW QUALITY PROTEIN: histamine H2 receptor n=1 Tax=Macrotis lagotis TaxID=92651 RepID=UPI003D692D87
MDTHSQGSSWLQALIGLVLILLILITVFGNVVVCLAVGLNRRLRSLTNCFIVSLAITDLLLGLLVLPFSAACELGQTCNFAKPLCNIYTSLDVMLCTASILNLFMISLDRYYAITAPLRYTMVVTPKRVAIALIFIWLISITFSFLPIHLEWNTQNITTSNQTLKCKLQVNKAYGLVDGLITFYIPLLVMCATYYRIFKIAREQAKRINHSYYNKAVTIREHKATVTLAVVMGAFIICWFPYFTVFVYRGIRGDINETFETIVLWLGYVNSALNPILYAALNRDFRTAYQCLFCCRGNSITSRGSSLSPTTSRQSQNQSHQVTLGLQEETSLRLPVQNGSETPFSQEPDNYGTSSSAGQRKPFLAYISHSRNILTCWKNMWGLKFLSQRQVEESGEELSNILRTPPPQIIQDIPSQTTEDITHQAILETLLCQWEQHSQDQPVCQELN